MAWARVHLERGRSSGHLWEVGPSAAGARIDVGSSPNCVWQVHAPGVRPFHLEMFWDGEVLWVADLEGAEVRIDGQTVDDWYATANGTRIELGGASMRVETSGTPPMDFDRSSSAGATDAMSVERPRIEDEATRIEGGIHSAATRVVTGTPRDALDEALERISGGGFRRERTRAIFGGAAGDADPQATRLVRTPESRLAGAPGLPIHRRPPPPRIGLGARRVAPVADPPKPQTLEPQPVPQPLARPEPARPRSNPPPPSALPAARPAPNAPGSSAPPAAGPPKPRFAPPPPVDAPNKGSGRAGGKGGGGKKEMSLPPRTWALLGATVGALAYVIVMDDGAAEEEPPPPAPVANATVEAKGETADGDEDEAEGEGERAEANAGAEPEAAETGGPAEDEVEDAESDPLVLRAANALMAGRQREALELYSELAERHPRNEAYAAIARILRKRVEDCPGGGPCE